MSVIVWNLYWCSTKYFHWKFPKELAAFCDWIVCETLGGNNMGPFLFRAVLISVSFSTYFLSTCHVWCIMLCSEYAKLNKISYLDSQEVSMPICSLICKTPQPKLGSNDVLHSAHKNIKKSPVDCHLHSDSHWVYSLCSRDVKFNKTLCIYECMSVWVTGSRWEVRELF